jgi:ABC-2 type transport system ATP-binding protein
VSSPSPLSSRFQGRETELIRARTSERQTSTGTASTIVPQDTAVAVRDLVKTYPGPDGRSLIAVDGLSFDVRHGEIFGLLGPNGAGKTTTLEIVEGLKEPTSGRTFVLGLDSQRERDRVKERIGVQLQAQAYFGLLTLEEILNLFGSLYPQHAEAGELLELVGLADKRAALVKHLSGGQARRFSVAASLVNNPDVVFLDEPTTGLDPQARRSLWELVRSLNREEGKTVILTTHYLEEAETLADRVAIIDNGRIQALDRPAQLIRTLSGGSRIRFASSGRVDTDELEGLPGVVAVEDGREDLYTLRVSSGAATMPGLVRWSEDRAIELRDLQVEPASLEDVFLSVTGRTIRD